ncbi:MAG TPA: SDR family NAD(P)-dependent oxidoreductase [Thermoleophilaceae bacterium]|nr:SDR family NAD(P)-dependent oxidoreductase [Thermoleophilaceae bacterium]
MDLTGRTALVTGANRGIGRAIVDALAEHPLDLLLCGMRDPSKFEAPAAGRVKEVRPVALDLSSRESIDQGVAGLDADVDLLVNNAGLVTGGLLEEQDLDDVYAMFQVNLLAVVQLTRALLPGMLERKRGKIVNNASISGYAYFPAASTYAASKAGVVAFTESLRRETHDTGVTCLHLVTGGVETDMLGETEDTYGRHLDTSNWDSVPAGEWAGKVVKAIQDDDTVLGPGGKTSIAKLASRGPGFLLDRIAGRSFSREPRY